MTTSPDATYIHWPIHQQEPSAKQLANYLVADFHAQCREVKKDFNRGVTVLRIVAPHEAVHAAVDLYLGARTVPYVITREAS